MNQKINEFVTMEKFKPVVKDVNNLKSSMDEAQINIDYVQKVLNKLKDQLDGLKFPSVDDFNTLKHRIDKIESSNNTLKKSYGDLDNQLKQVKQPESGANQEQVDRLTDELARLKAAFEEHRDYAQKNVSELVHEMPHKADK